MSEELPAIHEQLRQEIESKFQDYRVTLIDTYTRIEYAQHPRAESELHPSYVPDYPQANEEITFTAKAERLPLFYGESVEVSGVVNPDGIHITKQVVSKKTGHPQGVTEWYLS